MSLSSLQLDAFQAVAREKTFSAAARALALTQSALSQRVLNLEEELGATLFVREPTGARLTATGERLLRYCQTRAALEEEFRGGELATTGALRVAGFSTLNRSLVLPVLAEYAGAHPGVKPELLSAELRDLPSYLQSGRADFVFVTRPIEREGVESVLLGEERNVLIRPAASRTAKKYPARYLDHDADDTTTLEYLRAQGKKPPRIERAYLGEIYAILDAVRLGLGQAVVPAHLAREAKGVEIVPGQRPLSIPVYLCRYTQAFYPALQAAAFSALREGVAARLRLHA